MTHETPPSVSLESMEELVTKKMVRREIHTRLPLAIYNYSQMVQYKNQWSDLLMRCRGLVIDTGNGHVVASPMPKFFNYEEGKHQDLAMEDCDVIEKLDGSLGIYFRYQDEWVFSSRGSFVSSQAKKGGEMAKGMGLDGKCDPDYTYLFEVIYPQNKIVVDYGDRSELVLLAMVRINTAEDLAFSRVCEEAKRLGLSTPRAFPPGSPDALQALNTANEEGFIIRSRTTGERVKLKFSHYLETHAVKMRFSMAIVRAWFFESANGELSPRKYEYVPDEMYGAVKDEWARFTAIAQKAREEFGEIIEIHKALKFQDVPNSSDKGWICKYLRLSRSGDEKGAAAVFDEFAKHRIKEAPEITYKVHETTSCGDTIG